MNLETEVGSWNPDEKEIRAALEERFAQVLNGRCDTAIIHELGLCRGQARVDLVVVNGWLHGFEIKSDRDTLRRLDAQVDYYSKVLDQATLVVGERHFVGALAKIPDWWGVIEVSAAESAELTLVEHRPALMNPDRDPRALVELLWVDDTIEMLSRRNLARGVRGKPRYMLWDRVCANFELDEIAAEVRGKLKARTGLLDPA